MEIKLIPKKVVEIAKDIEQAKNDPNTMGVVFTGKKRWGVKAAIQLAESENIGFEFGTIKIGSTGEVSDIIQASVNKSEGSMTITVRPRKTEDIDCEIIQHKIENK